MPAYAFTAIYGNQLLLITYYVSIYNQFCQPVNMYCRLYQSLNIGFGSCISGNKKNRRKIYGKINSSCSESCLTKTVAGF